jgi:hypothetical protein
MELRFTTSLFPLHFFLLLFIEDPLDQLTVYKTDIQDLYKSCV